jgi:uncharacterized protein
MSARPPNSVMLLIDGYNIIGAWPDLQQVKEEDSLEEARRSLVESLTSYTAFQGYATQVVFDAQYRVASSNREVITPQLSVHYTEFGQTADTYIEKFCAISRHTIRSSQSRLIVATSDRTQQLMVAGYGAEWISAQRLYQEVEQATLKTRNHAQKRERSQKRFLAHSLDPLAKARLARLRLGLPLDEPGPK